MTSLAPKEAREALDQAIRDYAAATYEDGQVLVTGWAIVAAAIGPEHTDDMTSYVTETMPGQPWHAALGLLTYALDESRRSGDPE